MAEDDLVDKSVIDNSGNIVGKCIEVRNNGEDENVLIVEAGTKQGRITIDIPMSTIQAIGKTIVLAVEIEGLLGDQEIIPLEEIAEGTQVAKSETVTSNSETEETTTWVIYKSIKSKK